MLLFYKMYKTLTLNYSFTLFKKGYSLRELINKNHLFPFSFQLIHNINVDCLRIKCKLITAGGRYCMHDDLSNNNLFYITQIYREKDHSVCTPVQVMIVLTDTYL